MRGAYHQYDTGPAAARSSTVCADVAGVMAVADHGRRVIAASDANGIIVANSLVSCNNCFRHNSIIGPSPRADASPHGMTSSRRLTANDDVMSPAEHTSTAAHN